jgi:signal peptidase I
MVEAVLGVVANWLVIMAGLRTSFAKAILAWLPTLIPAGAGLAFMFWVMKPYLVEAFIMPNNSSAPTLIGPHTIAPCPHCGGALVLPDTPSAFPGTGNEGELGICVSCLKTARVHREAARVERPDRFFVNKRLTPRRWDLIAFRSLQDPDTRYVKRLVGLPGEEIVIKDGAIWVNGVKQQPAGGIAGLYFSEAPDGWGEAETWGSAERPARLGEDEYFVIGDFTLRSADSRIWNEGPPGHSPFAIPRSYVEGVATVIYWPPARWRIFR